MINFAIQPAKVMFVSRRDLVKFTARRYNNNRYSEGEVN